ncbi:hypothetical protein [Candidatus Amarolinea dominans]|uniref:hypothetical protein n=1 Tax=Candidatus Amarolinea dominans TaxID=3140696 RepID=UPI0031CC3BA2
MMTALASAFSASGQGQPQGRFGQALALAPVELDTRLAVSLQRLHRPLIQVSQLGFIGQAEVNDRDLFFQLRRDAQHRREQNHGAMALLQGLGQVAQLTHDLMILEEGVKVAQNDQRRGVVFHDAVERHEWITFGRVLATAGLVDEALRTRPGNHLLARLGFIGQLLDFGQRAFLFRCHHVQQRIAGTNVNIEFLAHRILVLAHVF